MKKILGVASFMIASLLFASCQPAENENAADTQQTAQAVEMPTITEQEVLDAQKAWSDGIVRIGQIYTDGGDYTAAALEHIETMYAYDMSPVLFKPTLAAETQFRPTKEGALAYFVGANEKYAEDKGFAIKPWTSVRWDNRDVIIEGNMAVAMGNYFFTPAEGEETKVEYTFAYTEDENGDLRIVLHHSSLPFNPN
jgi:hypothetical protein